MQVFSSTSRRPHCIAAVCWFLLRGCVFRPDAACQKRFSWFLDWIQKGAKGCKSYRSRQESSNKYLVFTCKIWLRYHRSRETQSLPKNIEWSRVRKNLWNKHSLVLLREGGKRIGVTTVVSTATTDATSGTIMFGP